MLAMQKHEYFENIKSNDTRFFWCGGVITVGNVTCGKKGSEGPGIVGNSYVITKSTFNIFNNVPVTV